MEDTRHLDDIKYLDQALEAMESEEIDEYEEAIELWITYGGD
jgi:hypothetical protein